MADERLLIEPCIQQPWGNDIIRVRQTIACRVIRKFIALLSISIVASVGATFAIISPRFLGSNPHHGRTYCGVKYANQVIIVTLQVRPKGCITRKLRVRKSRPDPVFFEDAWPDLA